MKKGVSILSVSIKTIALLCCVSAFFLALFSSCTFAAPLQQTALNTESSAIFDCKHNQAKMSLSNALLHDAHNGTITNSRMFNLVSYQNNEDKQDSQTATLGANNQPIALNTVTISDAVGYIHYSDSSEDVYYDRIKDLINAINRRVDSADVYFLKNATKPTKINDFCKPIEINDGAHITLHLCGHVISPETIIVEDNAILTVIGSENDTQASQVHTLSGIDKNGEQKKYDNVRGGVINTNMDSTGITISGKNSTVDLTDTTIFGCNETDDNGGGIAVYGNNTTLYLNHSPIQHCNADSGGGIYIDGDNTYISMICSSIDNNHADDHGAGIYCNAENVTIEDNGYRSDDIRSTISYNKADDDGGGIYSDDTGLTINKLLIDSNQADNGGGAYINSEDNTFNGCTFTGNTSEQAGSALYDDDDDNTLINCTITENNSKSKEGAIYVDDQVDINLEGFVNISSNTGCDVYLAEALWWRAYIMINPNKFDMQSSVGVFIEDIDDEAIFAKTIKGTGGFPISAKNCFHINNGSYSVARDEKDKTRLVVVKA